MNNSKTYLTALLLVLSLSQASCALPIRLAIKEYKKTQQANDLEANESVVQSSTSSTQSSPEGMRILRDVSYGSDSKQRMDVYLPHNPVNAPVIFMVHGGAWRFGDKANSGVVQTKVARWVPKGFIFISANYRLLPDTAPLQQAEDIAKALSTAQAQASTWGGDPSKFIIMGHSAGAHLVALISANTQKTYAVGAKPWLGTVSLDSAALNLVQIMEKQHHRLYDKAFGSDHTYWHANSPAHVVTSSSPAMLAVCSTQRKDGPCPNARDYATKALSLGVRTEILEQDLSHGGILGELGKPGPYTDAVEKFMGSLHTAVSETLKNN